MPRCRRGMLTSRKSGTRCWRSATMPISGGGSPNTVTTTISSAIARKPEHDPEKACPGLDPGWTPVFGKDHAQPKTRAVCDSITNDEALGHLHRCRELD